MRIGIDDFVRKLVGKISDLKTHEKNDIVNAEDELWELKVEDKKVIMFAPY